LKPRVLPLRARNAHFPESEEKGKSMALEGPVFRAKQLTPFDGSATLEDVAVGKPFKLAVGAGFEVVRGSSRPSKLVSRMIRHWKERETAVYTHIACE
jgi:hypothetical protein